MYALRVTVCVKLELDETNITDGGAKMACQYLVEFLGPVEMNDTQRIKQKGCKLNLMPMFTTKCEQFPSKGSAGSGCWRLTKEQWEEFVRSNR